MDEKHIELMQEIAAKAEKLNLEIEDLAIAIIEGVGINCPEIYEVVRKFAGCR